MAVAKAYTATQESAGIGGGGKANVIGDANFGQMVQNAINDAVSTSQHAEQQMTAHTQGKAALIDVATAISSAQASLETVMAVRDQVISAYQEIMRMTI
jgi:flagellar hook-basal body complex protein FliE